MSDQNIYYISFSNNPNIKIGEHIGLEYNYFFLTDKDIKIGLIKDIHKNILRKIKKLVIENTFNIIDKNILNKFKKLKILYLEFRQTVQVNNICQKIGGQCIAVGDKAYPLYFYIQEETIAKQLNNKNVLVKFFDVFEKIDGIQRYYIFKTDEYMKKN